MVASTYFEGTEFSWLESPFRCIPNFREPHLPLCKRGRGTLRLLFIMQERLFQTGRFVLIIQPILKSLSFADPPKNHSEIRTASIPPL